MLNDDDHRLAQGFPLVRNLFNSVHFGFMKHFVINNLWWKFSGKLGKKSAIFLFLITVRLGIVWWEQIVITYLLSYWMLIYLQICSIVTTYSSLDYVEALQCLFSLNCNTQDFQTVNTQNIHKISIFHTAQDENFWILFPQHWILSKRRILWVHFIHLVL